MLKLEVWVIETETLELIAPQVGDNVLGRLVWGCLSHGELLELRVKILSFTRIRLELFMFSAGRFFSEMCSLFLV